MISSGVKPISVLRMHQVSKVYGAGPSEVRALHDVDLNVEAGTMVAVMGPADRARARC